MGDRMSNEVTSYANWSQVPFAGSLPAVKDMSHLRIKTSGGNLVMPYNYVPFFAAPAADPQLGNGPAPTHERWREGTYSGSITLQWEAERPILAGVLSRAGERGIPIYDIPRTPEGHPVLQGTMTKGPLRNLYAAVTGSRLDSLPSKTPLTYRSRPQDALHRRLARVRKHDADEAGGRLVVDICRPPDVDASLLTHRHAEVTNTVALPREHLGGHGHGVRVWAWLELAYHPALVIRGRTVSQPYHYWRTVSPVVPVEGNEEPAAPTEAQRGVDRHEVVYEHPIVLVFGQIHETGEETFGQRKHDERLWVEREVARWFGPGDLERPDEVLTDKLVLADEEYQLATQAWRAVLESYIGAEPPHGHRPAHYTRKAVAVSWAMLDPGQTMYYLGKPQRPELHVFVPGMVSRESYVRSPARLLPRALRPASTRSELSAVQRVFGTVTEGEESFADKGLLEFGGLRCANVVLPAPAEQPWTLAPQGQPKAGYGRFTTVGLDIDGRQKAEFFGPEDGLAGRRVWLHHQATMQAPPPGGWPFDLDQRKRRIASDGRPYLADLEAQSDSQVTQFSGWIPPGAVFEQTVRFKNLSALELGALLVILDMPKYHHIGRARGFGFGSVTVRRVNTRIRSAEQRRASLLTLAPVPAHLPPAQVDAIRNAFHRWARENGGAATMSSVLQASFPCPDVRYPTLSEYGHLETGKEGSAMRPGRPPLNG